MWSPFSHFLSNAKDVAEPGGHIQDLQGEAATGERSLWWCAHWSDARLPEPGYWTVCWGGRCQREGARRHRADGSSMSTALHSASVLRHCSCDFIAEGAETAGVWDEDDFSGKFTFLELDSNVTFTVNTWAVYWAAKFRCSNLFPGTLFNMWQYASLY